MFSPKTCLIYCSLCCCLAVSTARVCAEENTATTATFEEEVIVSATRIPTPIDEVGSSITVITNTEISENQRRFVDDALRFTAGVDSTHNGARGTLTNVRIRGQGTEASFVVIDGIEVSDPSTTQTRFNFANLVASGIERIEVLRGSQSVLYGGDAVGGVINITTRSGGTPGGALYTETGSYGTRLAGADINGATGNKRARFGVSLQHYATDGFSAADSALAGNNEADGYDNTSFNGRGDVTITDNVTLQSAIHYAGGTSNYDAFGGAFGDDPDLGEDYRQLSAKVAGNFESTDGVLFGNLSYSIADNHRDGFDNGVDTTSNRGKRSKWTLHGSIKLTEANTLAVGVEHEQENLFTENRLSSGRQRAAVRINGYYVLQQLALSERWHLSLGARLDDHATFGSFDTYRIATAYQLGNSLLKASAATGFRAPSLFELYGVCCGERLGNEALQPEQSQSFDIGIQHQWLDQRLGLEATLFYIKTDNEIAFDGSTFGNGNLPNYFNIGSDTRSRGIEISHHFNFNDRFRWLINYTYNQAQDARGVPLSQRPKHAFSADFSIDLASQLNSHLSVRHNHHTVDTDFSTFPEQRVKLDEPWLLDIIVNYQVTERLRATARIENALDERYQAVFGYGAARRAVYAGLHYTFIRK